jgi:hypothetical protein
MNNLVKNNVSFLCVALGGLLALAGGCGKTENAAPSTMEAEKMTGAAKPEPAPTAEKSASLTAEQAKTLAIRLANDKALTLYNRQPFRDGQPARFVAGQWVWDDLRGFGHGDIQATVKLAADGSTISVDLKLLDSRNQKSFLYQ